MADKGDKGKAPVSRGKTSAKSLPKRQGSLKGKDSISLKKKRVISSDSDSEGFIEEKSPALEVNDKTPSDVRSSKKKVSFDELKSGGKASYDTPTNKGDSGKAGSGKAGGKGDSGKAGSGKAGGKGYSGDSGKAGSGKAGGKGYSGKGGGKENLPYSGKVGEKVEKGGKGGGTPLKVPVTEVELKLELELPKSVNTRVLMDCEATDILQGIQDHLSDLAEDPTIKIPEAFDKALEYSKINNHYTNATSARQILDTLKSSGVTSGEICMIGNICPDSVEEVYALLPSLKANRTKTEGPIKDVLAELAMLTSM